MESRHKQTPNEVQICIDDQQRNGYTKKECETLQVFKFLVQSKQTIMRLKLGNPIQTIFRKVE